ncbi:hypothetical protein PIB30_103952, partial [Stylosanthes scabra]|nr:hypothetical protein [Stylosanthes scabra]
SPHPNLHFTAVAILRRAPVQTSEAPPSSSPSPAAVERGALKTTKTHIWVTAQLNPTLAVRVSWRRRGDVAAATTTLEPPPSFLALLPRSFVLRPCHYHSLSFNSDRRSPLKDDLKDTANLLILGLRDLNRVPEAVKYAEFMIERGIKLTSSTLSKLKQSLVKERKEFVYVELLRKWKRSH